MKATKYKSLAALGVVPLIFLVSSCLATRKFVRNSQAPQDTRIQAVDQKVDQKTSQNAQAIKELSDKTEAGISQAQNSADQANQAAKQASESAAAANQTGERGITAGDEAQSMVKNLQNFRVAHHTVITFGLNKFALTPAQKQTLDEVAQSVGSLKLYVIQVQGYTDHSGPVTYNLVLSQHRANAVIRYLSTQHNIPLAHIYGLGYGEDSPVAPNNTRQGRGLNRRVEITVLVPQMEGQAAQVNPATAPNPNR
ncbi:MAG: OmpA family protein [Acidobacteriota bacterium]